jgi:hemerythrin
MPILVWSDDYRVNVAEIDEQHKKLLEHVNKLHAGVEAQIDKKDLLELLVELYDYTAFHFASEEKLMGQHGMKKVKKHHKEHKLLLKHLKHICNAVSDGKRPAFYSKYDVSNDWFLTHIMDFDKKMGVFLNSKGVY